MCLAVRRPLDPACCSAGSCSLRVATCTACTSHTAGAGIEYVQSVQQLLVLMHPAFGPALPHLNSATAAAVPCVPSYRHLLQWSLLCVGRW